jgi:hypothetical protein
MDMTSEELIGEILDTDRRRNQGEKKTQETALKTFTKKSGKKFNNSGSAPGATGTCHNCGKKGHWAKDCWEKPGNTPPKWYKPKNKDKAQQADEPEKDYAFMARKSPVGSSDWIADTGATIHITNSSSIFIDYRAELSEINGVVPGMSL